jgi:hypothetical protein
MEDKNWWKRLEVYLMARIARAGLADLHRLGLRNICERVLNGVYRIVLSEGFEGYSLGHMRIEAGEMRRNGPGCRV